MAGSCHTLTRPGAEPGVFFFNDTATTEIYTLSLHDALPICLREYLAQLVAGRAEVKVPDVKSRAHLDRKSTRLNSSHANISYAVFCLKKKKRATSSSGAWPGRPPSR